MLIILKNLDILIENERGWQPTIAGLLVFGGERIKQLLPQSRITCIKINGTKITDVKEDHKFFTRDVFLNFDDRVEIKSPGKLPNTITVEKNS